MDNNEYIKENVGKDLIQGLAAILQVKPEDPVRFLGEYLKNIGESRVNGKEKEIKELLETITAGIFPPANPWKYATTTKQVSYEPGELGIENLARQCVRQVQKKQFVLNIMIAGESGLGKSTFVNTLFSTDLLQKRQRKVSGSTMKISAHRFGEVIQELVEDGVKLDLSVIDTPGFGDQMNRELSIKPIVEYIDTQFESFYVQENSPGFRKDARDPRVHVILYFINPNCHRLKELDITVLKTLSTKANVIPIIAKADTLTAEERLDLKAKIISDLIKFDVKLYPGGYSEDREENLLYESFVPFSVIGADTMIDVNGRKVRARKYRWGLVEVENENHCDFLPLREMLMSKNLRDIVETAHNVHYFTYRTNKLRSLGRPPSILQSDDQFEFQIDSVRKQFSEEMARKEAEIREALFQKIKFKESSLREAEDALARKERELMDDLEEQKRKLEAEEREIELSIQRNAASKKGKDGKR